MHFHVITIFPDFVRSVFEYGVVRRALESGKLSVSLLDPRDFTEDKHRTTDDSPFGGGPGMVMLAEPIYRAVTSLREQHGADTPLIYLSPAGELLTQQLAAELAREGCREKGEGCGEAEGCREKGVGGREGEEEEEGNREKGVGCGEEVNSSLHASSSETTPYALRPTPLGLHPTPSLILLCGRYEGIDARVIEELQAREVSIGDYVLSGGELAAMVLIDAVARLLPGVLGNEDSSAAESFRQHADGSRLLDWPHYTRPENWRGRPAPEVLLSGNHAKIASFRETAALLLTYKRRPELLSDELRRQAERILGQEDHL